eukprot:Seg1329.11 transcript_id=Seg1329.11/GoldUCD/mRNA.D3Y31 product="hypothetical protein" protein_id=Seg1329.11/GoldUCD/D3Y31
MQRNIREKSGRNHIKSNRHSIYISKIGMKSFFQYFLICAVSLIKTNAAPLRCNTPTELAVAFEKMASEYLIVMANFTDSVPQRIEVASSKHNTKQPCNYKFVETRKNPAQVPQSLLVAECEKVFGGRCDPRCSPITYVVTVLVRDTECEEELGVKTWTLRQKVITVGYQMLF